MLIMSLTDFGMFMAVTMSTLDAVIFGFAASPLLQIGTDFNWYAFGIFEIIGIAIYFLLVFTRVPLPTSK